MKEVAAYYPGVYIHADTSRYMHPWFPPYNPEFKKIYFDLANMKREGTPGPPARTP